LYHKVPNVSFQH